MISTDGSSVRICQARFGADHTNGGASRSHEVLMYKEESIWSGKGLMSTSNRSCKCITRLSLNPTAFLAGSGPTVCNWLHSLVVCV